MLFLTIGVVSASENSSDAHLLENSIEDTHLAESSIDAVEQDLSEEANHNISDSQQTDNDDNLDPKPEDELNNSNENSSNSLPTISYKKISESIVVYPKHITKQYTSGYITFPVKLYDIVTYDGISYKSPRYNDLVKLKVYSGSKFKVYYGRVGSDGIAHVPLTNLALGNHKVLIFIGDTYNGLSYVKIIKATTTVYAPVKFVKYAGKGNFNVRVVDKNKFPVKNVLLKINVFSKYEYNTYSIKTDSYGVAKLKTGSLSLGYHRISISTKDKRYTISKMSGVIVSKSVPKAVEKLIVYAPSKVVKYGNNTLFKIEVKNGYGYPVKNILLKVNVFSGKKYKTYNLKTDLKGVAKFNTKSLSLGSHGLVIKSGDKNYLLSNVSKIVVNKNGVYNDYYPVRMVSLNFAPNGDGHYYAKLSWGSKKNSTYEVLRKSNSEFSVISRVTADSDVMSFIDRVNETDSYTYSVRMLITNGKTEKILGPYDLRGLKLIDKPQVKVKIQNMKSTITWTKVNGATKYMIFRKVSRDGQFKLLAVVDGNKLSYNDYYYKSTEALSKLLKKGVFIDPDFNALVYTVRACYIGKIDELNNKKSFGSYLIDGDFHLETPVIISLANNRIKWGGVPNADGYQILKKQGTSGDWEEIARVNKTTSNIQSFALAEIDNSSYYAVQAFAIKNGKYVYGGYDTGFSLINNCGNSSKYKIMYIGDSITYGTPNISLTSRHIFSIPYRVQQLIGGVYFNPSIPDSTYQYRTDGPSIIPDVMVPIAAGNVPDHYPYQIYISNDSEGVAKASIDYYDVVVLAAGTNDYKYNTPLGTLNSNDLNTFNGALNYILSKIESASKQRVKRGEEPIKIVFVDLYYSNCRYNPLKLENRDITPNNIGLTLSDYQKALDRQLNKWQNKSSYLSFYNFNTRNYGIVNGENCGYTTMDNIHFIRYTYAQYGNVFAQFLLKKVFV